MNNKAIGYFYTLMLGVSIIILTLALAGPAKEFKDTARSNSTADFIGLNCTSPGLDNYQEANCYVVDIIYYLVVGGGILIGIAIIGVKILW